MIIVPFQLELLHVVGCLRGNEIGKCIFLYTKVVIEFKDEAYMWFEQLFQIANCGRLPCQRIKRLIFSRIGDWL